jgi:hypothetical protein
LADMGPIDIGSKNLLGWGGCLFVVLLLTLLSYRHSCFWQ